VKPSFTTISGFGSNGAIIHYFPTEATNQGISNMSLYLIDSGGQYMEGTTDITRTLHFGTPSEEQKDRFTRVRPTRQDHKELILMFSLRRFSKDTLQLPTPFSLLKQLDIVSILLDGSGSGRLD